jgi:hypothetical protein
MKRVVNLLHRQAVKAKAEGLFFKVRMRATRSSQNTFTFHGHIPIRVGLRRDPFVYVYIYIYAFTLHSSRPCPTLHPLHVSVTPFLCPKLTTYSTQASTLYQFKLLLAEEKTFPAEQPYKDLMSLIKFILRQFFKALEKDRFFPYPIPFHTSRQNQIHPIPSRPVPSRRCLA